MRKRFLRSRSGEGYPMVIAVTLCLLMLFMLISEYFRVNIIVQGVRDAVQQAVIATVNENYDDVYHSVREGFALRSEVAAFQNGESDNILDFVSVDEYRKMEDELKKAYQYFEWNDRSGAYRYYEEIQKKVAAQVKDWKAINPRAEITSVRIMLFST